MERNNIGRKVLVFFLSLAVLILLFYIFGTLGKEENNNNSGIKSVYEDSKTIKLGFSLGTLKEERWIKDRDILMAKVKEKGADIIVQNANNDDKDQINQVKYLINQDIDVLIIVPNNLEKSAMAVELAKKQGIKVVSYDRLIMKSDVDLYISFDNEKVGELMAEYVVQKVSKGNILVINGAKSDYNTEMIKKGYDRVLKPLIDNGKLNIVKEDWSPNWMKEYAFKITDELLQEDYQIDAVISGNDGLAEGVIEALSEHRLAGKTAVVGQDADLSACQRIVEGTQLMTVYKPIEKLAEAVADMAIKLAKNENLNIENSIFDGKYDVPYYVLEPVVVDKENMDLTIIKDGFHMKEKIYRN